MRPSWTLHLFRVKSLRISIRCVQLANVFLCANPASNPVAHYFRGGIGSDLANQVASSWFADLNRQIKLGFFPVFDAVQQTLGRQQESEFANVGCAPKRFYERNNGLRLLRRPFSKLSAAPKLVSHVIEAHGVCGTPLGVLRAPRNNLSVLQMDLEYAGHLVQARPLGFRVDLKIYTTHHLLDVTAPYDRIVKLLQVRFSLQKQNAKAKLHTELRL
jgi:hypothetical protein